MSGKLKILKKLDKKDDKLVNDFIKDLLDFEEKNPLSKKPFRKEYMKKIDFYLQQKNFDFYQTKDDSDVD